MGEVDCPSIVFGERDDLISHPRSLGWQLFQGHHLVVVVQGPNITVLSDARSSAQMWSSRNGVYPPFNRWWSRKRVCRELRRSRGVRTLRILRSDPARILVQMAQLDKIFNLILQMSALVSVVPDVVVETTEFSGVSLGPISSQRLWSAVVDLLFSGHEDVLPGVD